MAYYLILAVRIILAPFIFVWPTVTVILSFLLDVIDGDFAVSVVSKRQYRSIDKAVDFWVCVFEMAYAWIYFGQFKFFLLALFLWRLVGLLLFYITQNQRLFVIFGNYFENVFFVVFFGFTTPPVFYFAVVLVTLIKFVQEWFIHVAELSVREDIFKMKRAWKNDKIV